MKLSPLAQMFADAYPDPVPFSTAEAFARSRHEDIVDMDDDTLVRERSQARMRWTYAPQSQWLDDRLRRLDTEFTRRQRQRR